MVRLREIPRTSAFAWSPGNASPLIATGTVAGALDADFSNSTQLEIWDLDLLNHQNGGELHPKASVSTDSRFHDIAWGHSTPERPKGIIAGGLESGSLDLWSADALLEGSGDSVLSTTKKHAGAIKSLQFNPFKSDLLATAGSKAEVFVWDLNNVENPYLLGNARTRTDDFESLDWNKTVPHILATGGSGGYVTVWDVKTKKESLTLNNLGRKAVNAVAWHPENATTLVTGTSDDSNPVVLVWDLRNSKAPKHTLSGHELGVLSVSWCKLDSNLLLTSGKDNRTIIWNPNSGERLGEYPVVANWTFQTRWNNYDPTLFATASYDGKITVNSIQAVNTETAADSANKASALEGADFFSQPSFEPQGSSFSLLQAPKWMKTTAGAKFGFGGKLVSFGLQEAPAGQPNKSKVKISKVAAEPGVTSATESFESAIKEGKLPELCEKRAQEAQSEEEREEWRVLKVLFEKDSRQELVNFLGFKSDEVSTVSSPTEETAGEDKDTDKSAAKSNRLSTFFDSSTADSEFFLSDLASIPSTRGAKTNNPFQIYNGGESEADRGITRAITLGHFEKAVDICLKEDRLSDAFMLAVCGGEKCIEKVRDAYFHKNAKGPNYLRLLACIVGKNLWDIVHNADLADWKEIIATICTFAKEDEFADLCEVLGDRLEEEFALNQEKTDLRKGATLAFMAGSKLERVVQIWVQDLKDNVEENAKNASSGSNFFSIHVNSLQNFIEKVTVFREATKFADPEKTQTSNWKLEALYEKYLEYADVVAASGNLDIAEKYLDLLPNTYPPADAARARIKEATKKATPASTARSGIRQNTRSPFVPQQSVPTSHTSVAASTYANPSVAANPYQQPVQKAPVGPYAQTTYQPPVAQPVSTPPNQYQRMYGGYQPPTNVYNQPPQSQQPPPPPAASIPPPSKATTMVNWNDTPIVSKPARRGTPSAAAVAGPITSPFPGAPPAASPVNATSPFGAPPTGSAPPPPPKNAMPPQRVASPSVSSGYNTPALQQQQPPYAAPPRYGQPPSAPPANVYAPPPSGASGGGSRYAPPPAVASAVPARTGSVPPPPPQGSFVGRPTAPPSGPYAPPPQTTSQYGSITPAAPAPGPYAPPTSGAAPPTQSRPQTQQSQVETPVEKPATPAPPAAPKYPKGDRSHIPEKYKPIVDLLESEIKRVKAVAPASAARNVQDTEKRISLLFDHLNNQDLLSESTQDSMLELAQAMASRDYSTAQSIHLELLTNKTDECGMWMTGVKRLIGMAKVTP